MRFLVKNWSKATSAVQFKLETPPGWEANPAQQSLSLAPGEERTLAIRVTPGAGAQAGYLRAVATAGAWSGSFSYDEVVYDHILRQMVFDPAEVRLVPLDLARKGTLVGYISGSGDEIPAMLEQMGYKVELLEDDKIEPAYLAKFDAVIAGIRVYNTNQRMRFHQEKILEYVKQGGTYLVQYNTNSDMATAQPGPYPLSISRERVTREQAPVALLKPDHIAFNSPNVITAADFDGWVQERGLYFPGKWDSQYEALTACADPGEPAREGALLVARYGEGYYVHSSFAWFRQLPAGVPGACRLFVNLISLGQ
jgi:hypothetical protein